MSEEKIHHPRHYNSHPSGVEAIVLCEHLGFNLGNALKYLFRHGIKTGSAPDEDLAKARFYLAREAAMPWSVVMVGSFGGERFVRGTMQTVIATAPASVLGRLLVEWLHAHDEERCNTRIARRMLVVFDAATDGKYDPDGLIGTG